MKKKRPELDVDFIGEQRPLTSNEEKIISEFIKASKLKKGKEVLPEGKGQLHQKKDANKEIE